MLTTHLRALNLVSLLLLGALAPYALQTGETGAALGAAGAVLTANAYFTYARAQL